MGCLLTDTTKNNTPNRNLAMDGIRGLAVLIVFLSHTSGRDQSLSPLLQFNGIGHVGVYLFFVLSGYLLASTLIDEWYRNGSISVKNFLIRRFFRIAPLYYFVLVIVFLYQQITSQFYSSYLHINNGLVGFIKHLFFIKGDGVFWTLPTEFIFYLILPWLVILGLRKGKSAYYFLSGCALVYFFWFLLILQHIIPETLALKLVGISHNSQFLDVFLCGVLASFAQRNKFLAEVFRQNVKIIDRVAVYGLLMTLLLTFAMVSFNFLGLERPFYGLRWASLGYGLIFAFIILATSLNGAVCKIFETKVLRLLGIVGFSWYLIHFFVLQVVNHFSLSPPLKFTLSTFLLVVLSSVLYVFIEIGKKFTQRHIR